MDLGSPNHTIQQPYGCESFALSPTPPAIEFAQARQFADRWANRERFDICDRAQDVEKHCADFSRCGQRNRIRVCRPPFACALSFGEIQNVISRFCFDGILEGLPEKRVLRWASGRQSRIRFSFAISRISRSIFSMLILR